MSSNFSRPTINLTTNSGMFNDDPEGDYENDLSGMSAYGSMENDPILQKVEQLAKEVRKQHPDGGIGASRILNTDILMEAPQGYFDEYRGYVRQVSRQIQNELADQYSELINDAQMHPTDEQIQNKAYFTVSAIANQLLQRIPMTGIKREILHTLICNEIVGFSVIEPLWQDPRVTEIVCHGHADIQVEIAGRLHKVPSCQFDSTEHLLRLIERLYRSVGKVLSQNTPIMKARLHDKSRLHTVHPVVAPDGPNFNIRKHPEGFWTPNSIVQRGTLSEELMTYLGNLIHKGCSILLFGGPGSGKALEVNTKIPTPNGLIPIGELKVGDLVYEHTKGATATVQGVFDHYNRDLYQISYSNGESITTDIDHLSYVNIDGHYREITTRELIENGFDNVRVPLTKPVQHLEHDLRVSPRLVGGMLYDESIEHIDVDYYLTASVQQRGELLRSLLSKSERNAEGHHLFTVHSDRSVYLTRLFSSLGLDYVKTDLPDMRTLFTVNVNGDAKNYITITAITKLENKGTTRCITVDSPAHTYLATEAHLTTHNTTLMNALTGFIPDHHHIISIEDNLEMKINPRKNVIAPMEAKEKAPDQPGSGVTIRDLVKASTQMRPEVIIVGETTDGAAYDLCQSLNTGSYGMSTVHANHPNAAITRICSLVTQSGMTNLENAQGLVRDAFDVLVQVSRMSDGTRKVIAVSEVGTDSKIIEGKLVLPVRPLWVFKEDYKEDDGKIVGHWEQVSELSDERSQMRMLSLKPDLSWEELKELATLPQGCKEE